MPWSTRRASRFPPAVFPTRTNRRLPFAISPARLRVWIEVGSPDAARLHKASKASPRVAVYTHRTPSAWPDACRASASIAPEALELYSIDPALISALSSRLDRRMAFALSISDRELFVSIGADTLTGQVVRRPIV